MPWNSYSQLVIAKTSNIARRAKRVVDVAEAEMENSSDPNYVAKVEAAKDVLANCEYKDRGSSFERNCVLCRWESETLK